MDGKETKKRIEIINIKPTEKDGTDKGKEKTTRKEDGNDKTKERK